MFKMRHIFDFSRNARKHFQNAREGVPDAPFSRNCARSGSTEHHIIEIILSSGDKQLCWQILGWTIIAQHFFISLFIHAFDLMRGWCLALNQGESARFGCMIGA